MATKVFVGRETAVAQVNTVTPANPEENDVFTIKIADQHSNDATITFTCGVVETVKVVVEGLQTAAVAAKAAGLHPWDVVTTTEDDAAVTITADVAGDPFFITATSTGDGAPADTLTDASVTAAAGPSLYDSTGNWEGEAIPVNGDMVSICPCLTTDIFGSDQSGVDLIGFVVEEGYGGAIGALGNPLKISLLYSAAYYDAHMHGTGTTYLDVTDYGSINIYHAGPPTDTVPYSLNLTGTHDASTANTGVINCLCGVNESVSIAANASDSGMEVNEFYVTGQATVGIGPLVKDYNTDSFPLLEMAGGDVILKSNILVINMTGGVLYDYADVTVTTANLYGGIFYHQSKGTITTVNVGDNGTIDHSKNLRARTITNCNRYGSGKIRDPFKTVTWTNGIDLVQGKIDGNIDLGNHITITPSAV